MKAAAQFAAHTIDEPGLMGLLRGWNGYQAATLGETTRHLTLGKRTTAMAVHVPKTGTARPGALIVLHGAGGSGAAMLPYFTGISERLGMAILCPDAQLIDSTTGNLDTAGLFAKRFRFPRWSFDGYGDFSMAAHRWALEHLDADPNRCVLVGVSMGGLACWNLAMRLWQHFAAAVPINGALSMWEMFGTDRRTRFLLPNVTTLPMFVIHGARDDQIPPRFDRANVAQLRADGHQQLSYVEVPDGSHPMSSLHFEDTGELVAQLEVWLASRRRTTSPPVIRHRALEDRHGRAHWISASQIEPGTGAEIVAERVADDAFTVHVTGAHTVSLYLTSERLEPGQPVTVTVNGETTTVRFEPALETITETYREHLDPALTAESVVTLPARAPQSSAPTKHKDGPGNAFTL